MSQRIPVAFRAEFRGAAPASSFTNRETGELVNLAENLKFEYTLADGEPDTIAVRATALDRVTDFDITLLKKGDEVFIEGVVVMGGVDRTYFRPISVRRAGAVAKAA